MRRILLAGAMEHDAGLQLCRSMILAANTVVCRLTASLQTMQRRVEMRESGMLQSRFVARVEILEAILDRARLEDFVVANENRSVTDVALELLDRAGWIAKGVSAGVDAPKT